MIVITDHTYKNLGLGVLEERSGSNERSESSSEESSVDDLDGTGITASSLAEDRETRILDKLMGHKSRRKNDGIEELGE
jgi:hypothetical protein